jgi:hypothetical protein
LQVADSRPHLRAFVGGNIAVGGAPSLGAGGWGPVADVGVQLSDAFGIYASARATTLAVVLAPTQVSAAVLAEWTAPFRLSIAAGAGWLWTIVPGFVDQVASQQHDVAFPLRVSFDVGERSGLRLSLEAGVAPFFSSRPFVWGGLLIGFAWR